MTYSGIRIYRSIRQIAATRTIRKNAYLYKDKPSDIPMRLHNTAWLLVLGTVISCSGHRAAVQDTPLPIAYSDGAATDSNDGTYRNPILHADYSDPDAIRVGKDFYMTASSFNHVPGLPILHSRNLVDWTLVGYALDRLPYPPGCDPFPQPGGDAGDVGRPYAAVRHGDYVWAPALRYHKGLYYIYFGDPNAGVFMTSTKDPNGPWEPLTCVLAARGIIDTCPFWDDDGSAWLVHAYAGSRAGIKSLLALAPLSADGRLVTGPSRIIYDGHGIDPTIEGPKLYKKDGWYYIFAPAGGVSTGWQTVLRSRSLTGPYERRVVMEQGPTPVNGPHQGAWVDTPSGEDWFLHFQDKGAYGRIVHLQPMRWQDGWPVIGADEDGDGIGNPLASFRRPTGLPGEGHSAPGLPISIRTSGSVNLEGTASMLTGNGLDLAWQWPANPEPWWAVCHPEEGRLSLYSVPAPEGARNLWDVPNLLLQKFPAEAFTCTTKLTLVPDDRFDGERAGLVVMGTDYALLSLERTADGFLLSQRECLGAEDGVPETQRAAVALFDGTVYLQVKVSEGARCEFLYSTDGETFQPLGGAFTAKPGKWIGAKVGLFCQRPVRGNDGGRADVELFCITAE